MCTDVHAVQRGQLSKCSPFRCSRQKRASGAHVVTHRPYLQVDKTVALHGQKRGVEALVELELPRRVQHALVLLKWRRLRNNKKILVNARRVSMDGGSTRFSGQRAVCCSNCHNRTLGRVQGPPASRNKGSPKRREKKTRWWVDRTSPVPTHWTLRQAGGPLVTPWPLAPAGVPFVGGGVP